MKLSSMVVVYQVEFIFINFTTENYTSVKKMILMK